MIFAKVIELMVNQVSFLNDSQMLITQIQRKVLTNPKSKSKSDLEFSLVTHFPTSHPPPPHPPPTHVGKVDKVQLGLPIENKSCLSMVVKFHNSV